MGSSASAATVASLRARISAMQATTLGARTLPTAAAVAPLLPGGALKAGVAYAVQGSLALTLLLAAAPTASGGWCGVVGVPELGAEAARGLGVDLARLVLVPDPGEHWLAVTAQIAEVLPVVVVRPPRAGAAPGEVARLASRLRQHGSTLLVAGRWPGVEAELTVLGGSWIGIEAGAGYLRGRELDVEVTARQIRSRHRVTLGSGAGPVSAAAPGPAVRRLEAV